MNRRILVLYAYANQKQLMQKFAEKLLHEDVYIDILCTDDMYFSQQTSVNLGSIAGSYLNLLQKLPNTGFAFRFFRLLFVKLLIKKVLLKYDLIDFHGYVERNNTLSDFCYAHNIPFDITLWGSDMMRADDSRVSRMKRGFEHCRIIKAVENVLDVVNEKYGNLFTDKEKVTRFGTTELDTIASIEGNEELLSELKCKLVGNIGDKLVVTCGYNAIQAQYHETMIEALCHLGNEYKQRLHILLPMTYGNIGDYTERIRKIVDASGFSYTILDKFLSIEEVAAVRMISDIAINIQKTDAFSASIQGQLYSQAVMVLGEWLRYPILEKNDVFYLQTSKDNLSETIKQAIDNYNNLKGKALLNKEKIERISTWKATITEWAYIYKM